jgi:hypothetical protein
MLNSNCNRQTGHGEDLLTNAMYSTIVIRNCHYNCYLNTRNTEGLTFCRSKYALRYRNKSIDNDQSLLPTFFNHHRIFLTSVTQSRC